jgi:hypothetical protein
MENKKEGDQEQQQRKMKKRINRNGKMQKYNIKEEEKKKIIIEDGILSPNALGSERFKRRICHMLLQTRPAKEGLCWTEYDVLPKKREAKSYKTQDLVLCQRKVLKISSGNSAT